MWKNGELSQINQISGQETGDKVTSTLDMMRNGQFTARPQWEDVFTSMVKPKPETQEKVKAMVIFFIVPNWPAYSR